MFTSIPVPELNVCNVMWKSWPSHLYLSACSCVKGPRVDPRTRWLEYEGSWGRLPCFPLVPPKTCLAQRGSPRWHCRPYGQSLKQGWGVFKGTRQQPEAGLSPQGSAAVWAEEVKLLLAKERQTYQLLGCNASLYVTHTCARTHTHTPAVSMYSSESLKSVNGPETVTLRAAQTNEEGARHVMLTTNQPLIYDFIFTFGHFYS